jgi:putative phosphoribosyl transferase
MQPLVMNTLLQDREEAGYLLSRLLAFYKNSTAVVVGIPHGGVCVASAISEALSLPLEIISCRKIKHPANGKKNIGSVSEDDVFINDCSHTIPQDYVYHQIALLQNAMAHETKKYYGSAQRQSLRYRTVILVDDMLASSDTMMACLRSIKKHNPLKIVAAVPIVAAEAARIVSSEADDFKFIKMESSLESPQEYFVEFPKIDDDKVKELFDAARKNVTTYE